MYEIAAQIGSWLEDGRDVTVAQVVATRGFSSRKPAAAAAWTAGVPAVGSLVEGVPPERVADAGVGLTDVTVSEDDAVAAGLACGGVASVLVQPAAAYPSDLWARLAGREPLCLVTQLDADGAPASTEVFTPTTIRQAAVTESYGDPVPRLFGRGASATAVIEQGGSRVAVTALWPVPTLVVVGNGLIADALAGAADLLGWSCRVTPETTDAVAAAGELHPSDAYVVLSHDRAVDGPALAAALAGRAGYVGALGSRRTQAARRDWLTEHGVADETQARIHGPAGLDIDAHTPGEIAVSIVAEILGARGNASGGALRDRSGPVHSAGVQAPPPRY